MENKAIKIYSYKRSGTHLLMKSLYDNFEISDTALNIKSSNCNLHWYNQNDKALNGVTVPWGKLFGSHSLPNKVNFNKQRSIYIFRSGIDVLWSNHRTFKIKKDFNDWITQKVIENWMNHVIMWLQVGIYSIQFEELIQDFDKTIINIETKFKLKRKNLNFTKTDIIIGWSPGSGSVNGAISQWNDENIKLYNEIVDLKYIQSLRKDNTNK